MLRELDRWRLGGWTGLLIVWMASFFYTASPLNEQVFCLLRRFTDKACPGCGLTRSFCAMSTGDLGAAFGFHWSGPLLYVAMVWVVLAGPVRVLAQRPGFGRVPSWGQKAFWGLAGLSYLGQGVRALSSW